MFRSTMPQWVRSVRHSPVNSLLLNAPVPAIYERWLAERSRDYPKRALLPGRAFASPADFTTQGQANRRAHCTLGNRRCSESRRLSLPPVSLALRGELDKGWP